MLALVALRRLVTRAPPMGHANGRMLHSMRVEPILPLPRVERIIGRFGAEHATCGPRPSRAVAPPGGVSTGRRFSIGAPSNEPASEAPSEAIEVADVECIKCPNEPREAAADDVGRGMNAAPLLAPLSGCGLPMTGNTCRKDITCRKDPCWLGAEGEVDDLALQGPPLRLLCGRHASFLGGDMEP